MTDKKNNSPFIKSDFQDNQERKREHFENMADKSSKASSDALKASRSFVEHIPMGQPILVGHHSERAHRRAIDKSWNKLGKAVELDNKSKHYEGRAASVGTGGIAIDDPDALDKLKAKHANLVSSQEIMKSVNREFRKGGWEAITSLSPEQVKELESSQPSYQRQPFAGYSLSNNNANIKQVAKRIREIEKLHGLDSSQYEFENDDFKMYVDDGRVCFQFFNGKPNDETRQIVGRSFSFKWSRFRGEWVRKATSNGLRAGLQLKEKLLTIKDIY